MHSVNQKINDLNQRRKMFLYGTGERRQVAILDGMVLPFHEFYFISLVIMKADGG